MAQEPLIDRTFLEKLERLAIHWRKSFPGLVGGHNLSRFPGPGQEFLDHRHFHHGDDLRAVNWRAYLRFEKLFLKMFRVEPHTPIRLLLDVSLSMQTGAQPKFAYAQKLAAALCYIGLVRLDSIAINPFNDSLADPFRCSGGRHRFAPAVDYITQLKPAGRTDYFRVVRQFVSSYAKRGLLIVISDFLDDADCEKALQYLADFGHELMLVHVWAEEDRNPPWDGELELHDAETGARLEIEFDDEARARYTAAFDEYARMLRRLALRNGGRYAGISTSIPIEDAVFGPLAHVGAVE
ncbi:MAG TPA: DUF58 domain-containing protein [Bryobacteraceae bacterium]|nr:DUF58 domain-containing protein [Bryobacteraceae bacterium]HOQ46020.1 DUF58 domain-containing protein [Bryobacteraceae bacterium]HPU72870.1 DUF58 domain-containing protein [Bryobacteraceae bacterium]